MAHVNACRDEDANMFQQGNQEVKNHIQALEHANKNGKNITLKKLLRIMS